MSASRRATRRARKLLRTHSHRIPRHGLTQHRISPPEAEGCPRGGQDASTGERAPGPAAGARMRPRARTPAPGRRPSRAPPGRSRGAADTARSSRREPRRSTRRLCRAPRPSRPLARGDPRHSPQSSSGRGESSGMKGDSMAAAAPQRPELSDYRGDAGGRNAPRRGQDGGRTRTHCLPARRPRQPERGGRGQGTLGRVRANRPCSERSARPVPLFPRGDNKSRQKRKKRCR